MRISQNGIDLIKRFEGCRTKAYQDTGGVYTIGWGHIKGVKRGDTAMLAECEKFLQDDLADAEEALSDLVKVPLHQNQYDALCAFVFNVGKKRFESSTLLKKLNAGLFDQAAAQFLRWIYDNGKVITGLVNRRQSESDLFKGKV